MVKETMTVTKALSELKLLDKKIEKAINGCMFIGVMQPKTSATPAEEIIDRIKSDYQKVNDLIDRRNAMKAALVMSNAITTVTVGSKTYSVAEAIDAKANAMRWKSRMLNSMASQANTAATTYTRMTTDVENKALDLVRRSGEDATTEAAKEMELYQTYIKNNAIVYIDPLDLPDLIQKLADEIDEFTLNVDTQLAVSNATTVLEFSYGEPDKETV